MRRAHARKAEQRRQSAAAWLARVCSALTHEVMDIVGGNVCIHAVSPAESSGQLRFLGSFLDDVPDVLEVVAAAIAGLLVSLVGVHRLALVGPLA